MEELVPKIRAQREEKETDNSTQVWLEAEHNGIGNWPPWCWNIKGKKSKLSNITTLAMFIRRLGILQLSAAKVAVGGDQPLLLKKKFSFYFFENPWFFVIIFFFLFDLPAYIAIL